MDPSTFSPAGIAAVVGVGAGLWLLVRGMGGYRRAGRISDTSSSAIVSMAAGEVRVSGHIEAAEVVLVSPLQSEACVYYDASIRDDDDVGDFQADFHEERAVGFQVRDDTGAVRIFPRRARWDVPPTLDDRGTPDDLPPGVRLRTGSAFALAEPDRAAAIEALLTVHPVAPIDARFTMGGRRRRQYRESRLAPGDPVTIIGRAMPFGDLADPAEADIARDADVAPDDPEVAADLAAARARGELADDVDDAWGNAAIPGFGIGRPVSAPELDPAAHPLPLAAAGEAEHARRTFDIAPETLVIAAAPDVPLLIVEGIPGAAVARQQDRFVVGLLGAVLAIVSAMAFALLVSGGLDGFGG